MKKSIVFILLAAFGVSLWAQTPPAPRVQAPDMTLVYADDETLMAVTLADGKSAPVELGMSIPSGATIRTNGTAAELQLVPNGTIVKLTANTVFKVEAIAGRDQGTSNNFALLTGKLRTVASRLAGGPTAYSVRTPTAVGAVRGTDFAMLVAPGQKDWICVQEGMVEFQRMTDGETLSIAAGQFADTFATAFAPVVVTPDRLAEIFSDLQFSRLDPATVPGRSAAPVAAKPQPAKPADPTPAVDTTLPEVPTPSETPDAQTPAAPKSKDPVMAFLADVLGFQVGSITIDNKTYAKALIQPKIHTDSFKLGLYLPVIYSTDLFDPANWYQPKGNNEWSFGTDQSEPVDKVVDGFQDLMLKIRYLEVGRPGFDPFYLKVGNLSTMTLGHGSIVGNFANDQDFPAIRRLGLNTGWSNETFTVEALFDDLTDLQVTGGRFAVGAGGFQVGLTGVVDLFPAKDFNTDLVVNPLGNYGNPLLIAAGLDMQLFKADLGVFSALGFVDAGTVTLYGREPNGSRSDGLATQTIFDPETGTLKSFSVNGGLYGKVLALVDYRLEVRFEKGLAKVGLFDSIYPRSRLSYVEKLVAYLDDPAVAAEVDATSSMGVYGSAGFDLFGLLIFKGAYYWPWTWTGSTVVFAEEDSLELKLTIPKGKIPVVNLHGSVAYTRTKFVPTLIGTAGTGVTLFDANTVFSGEVVYGLLEGMDLAATVSTAVVRDTNGDVMFETNGQPMIRPSINIETRISF